MPELAILKFTKAVHMRTLIWKSCRLEEMVIIAAQNIFFNAQSDSRNSLVRISSLNHNIFVIWPAVANVLTDAASIVGGNKVLKLLHKKFRAFRVEKVC